MLTATSLSYGKAKNSTPHRIKTPYPIEIKFGRVDCVGEGTRHAKFYADPSKGGLPGKWVKYTQKICSCTYTFFFRNSPTGQTLRRNFARDGLNDAVSRKDVFLKMKLIFNVFIRKNRKKIILQWRLWGKLSNSLNGHNFVCV